jgi:hypothetical protein
MFDAFDIIQHFYFWLARVAVEAIRIRRERPDRLRGGLKVPVPVKIEFSRHVN